MGPLALIIALELVITSGIIGFSSSPKSLAKTKHTISSVLGIQKIAQAPDQTPEPAPPEQPPTPDSSTPPASPTSPALESVPTPSENPAAAPEQPMPSVTITPETPSPSETPGLFEQGQESLSPQSSEEPSPSPALVETSMSQTQAVLSPEDLINSPENINNKSVEEVKKEDTQLDQATDPAQQTKLLVDFATDKVKDMNNFSKSDDFASTNFAAQRFNEQMDKAIGNLEKIPLKDQAQVKKQLVNFCDQADKVLRTVGLSVPEEGEQDLEMARGQCQELNL